MDRAELYSIIDNAARIVPPGAVEMSASDLQEWLIIVADSDKTMKDTKKACRAAAKVVHDMISGMYEMPNHQPADESFPLTDAADLAPELPEAAPIDPPTEETPAVAATTELDAPAAKPAKGKKNKPKKDGNANRTNASNRGGAKLPGVTPPPTKRKSIAHAELVFHRELQQRHHLFDLETVEKYQELYQDGKEDLGADKAGEAMAPLDVIELTRDEADELGFQSTFVVWNGFQRGEAAQRAKVKTLPCNVAPGTWSLARKLSLGANGSATLPRSYIDLRRAFQTLIEDEPLLNEVLSDGVGKGGAQRAICRYLNISKGAVGKYLAAMGLKTAGDRIIKAPTPKLSGDDGPKKRNEKDPAGLGAGESADAIKARATGALLVEMQRHSAALQRRFEALVTRDDVATTFKELARKNGIPVSKHKVKTGVNETTGESEQVAAEYWPAIDTLVKLLDEVVEAHADTQTSAGK